MVLVCRKEAMVDFHFKLLSPPQPLERRTYVELSGEIFSLFYFLLTILVRLLKVLVLLLQIEVLRAVGKRDGVGPAGVQVATLGAFFSFCYLSYHHTNKKRKKINRVTLFTWMHQIQHSLANTM